MASENCEVNSYVFVFYFWKVRLVNVKASFDEIPPVRVNTETRDFVLGIVEIYSSGLKIALCGFARFCAIYLDLMNNFLPFQELQLTARLVDQIG